MVKRLATVDLHDCYADEIRKILNSGWKIFLNGEQLPTNFDVINIIQKYKLILQDLHGIKLPAYPSPAWFKNNNLKSRNTNSSITGFIKTNINITLIELGWNDENFQSLCRNVPRFTRQFILNSILGFRMLIIFPDILTRGNCIL